MKTIIFATTNAGKVREVNAIMQASGYEVISLKQAGIAVDVDENGTTFEENAKIKAKAIWEITVKTENYKEAIILADDSGLEIDYLNGEPGIYSARYLGEDTSYDYKNKVILERMENVPEEERGARFVCAMAAVMPDGEVLCEKGIMEGKIAHAIEGTNGFGYDPIFYLPEFGMTSASISPEQKNEISHRGRALRLIKDRIDESVNCQ